MNEGQAVPGEVLPEVTEEPQQEQTPQPENTSGDGVEITPSPELNELPGEDGVYVDELALGEETVIVEEGTEFEESTMEMQTFTTLEYGTAVPEYLDGLQVVIFGIGMLIGIAVFKCVSWWKW